MRESLQMARLASLLVFALAGVDAIYFHVTEGQNKCFIEEVPGETLVMGTYKSPDFIEWGRPEFTGTVGTT